MVKVSASLDSQTAELTSIHDSLYQGALTASVDKTISRIAAKMVKVVAEGDNGERTTKEKAVYINQNNFELRPIIAYQTGEEIGYFDAPADIDIGDTMDFELTAHYTANYDYGYRIFIPGTEFGGILKSLEVQTGDKKITWRGPTWRGMLTKKVVEPPAGQEHLVLSGDLNDILRALLGERLGDLFRATEDAVGITVTNWQVDRYATLYDAMIKLLQAYGHRLQIAYVQPEGLEYGYVALSAAPITDWSEEIEYSQDTKLAFTIKDDRSCVNHLVCVGEGQNQERAVLHLYVQADGSIGKTPYYTGLAEVAEIYNYSSADIAELEKGGTEKLIEAKNYKKMSVDVSDIDLELGDIISGYEAMTNTTIKKPIINKILRISANSTAIEYKIEGDD